MSLRAIVIDDEEGPRESLSNILEQYCPDIELVGKASSASEAFKMISAFQVEVVFLDIEMPRENAFDLLEKFKKINFQIIFTTAYDHYAIKAIKYSALDYLLKPVDIDELRQAIANALEQKEADNADNKFQNLMANLNPGGHDKKIAIPETDGLLFIKIKDIVRCESEGNYTKLILESGKKLIASKTLGDFEDLLPNETFVRTHRSHLINIHYIEKYIKGEGGYVILTDGSNVEVSRRKKPEFMAMLSKL